MHMRPPFLALPSKSLSKLRVLSERPPILAIPQLLTQQECDRLIAKAAGSMLLKQQGFDDETTHGQRTSCGVVVRNEEVPTLRSRFAELAGVELAQLQPLKISRYMPGQRFDMHTDAIRGDARGAPLNPDDYWDDLSRASHGVIGAPISGCNRIATIFAYLNTVGDGGRTRWRWTQYDACSGGSLHDSFYSDPGPGHGRTDVLNGSGPEVAVAPEAGLGVIHFPSTTPENGGWTDYNAFHEAEPPGEGCVKYVCQQFIWSHPRLDWTRVLDEENWEPQTRISDDTI